METEQMSVVIVRHSEDIDLLKGCLDQVSRQEGLSLDVRVLDQNPDIEVQGLVNSLHGIGRHSFTYHEVYTYSLARSRNLGISLSACRFVAFIDPDCRVGQNWARSLYSSLQRPRVGIAGGKIVPLWMGKERWLHDSVFVKEMAAYLDLGEDIQRTDRVLGSNFSVDREVLGSQCCFRENLGRSDKHLYGGEETDLCERASRSGVEILFVPEAMVTHIIPPHRMTITETFRRAFFAGMSRGNKGGRPRSIHRNHRPVDWLALALLFPFYTAGYFYGKLKPLRV